MKLENKYSWEEIGELFADRIEQSKFIEPFKRNEFIEWFKEREKIGICFDWRLVARAYIIWQHLKKEGDHFTVIVGTEGSGKTTLATQLCAWVAPKMILEDLVFDMSHYIRKLQQVANNYKKNKAQGISRSILIDEGGISLFSREALTTSNKVLAKTFMVQRFLNVHVGICIPHFWSLDKLIREHRINSLIIVKERGYYKCITGKGIKILNKYGTKDKIKPLIAQPIPYGFFWDGTFNKEFPKTIDKEEYEKHKFKHIQNFLEDAKLEADTVKMIKVARLEREFGLKRDVIVNQIKEGKIQGRQIGTQWFITRKAYEKLIMAGKT